MMAHPRRYFFRTFTVAVLFSLAFLVNLGFSKTLRTLPLFTDITAQAGITWQQFSGQSQDRLLIETMGGGVGFLDYDGDGLQDLFFVNGGETPHGKSVTPVRNALYRNLGNGKFQEVAAKAGVDRINFYGMGVAVADYDNDGFPDLFITGFPSSALFHNNGDGTFTDVTQRAALQNTGKWGAGAAWFDYDRDGYLDLVIANYAALSVDSPKKCEVNGVRSYCEQLAYEGEPLTLFHNNHDGTFTDVSGPSGLGKLVGRSLGMVAIDVNDDGWTDLFISRDASPNLLLINQRNGTFKDVGVEAEVAYTDEGMAKAGMGVDAGDVSGDGTADFVVTNFNDQYHSLFFGSPTYPYQDRTVASHMAALTKHYVGWGVKFIDYDNDGNLDIVLVNGHINQVIERTRVDVKYKQPPLLLHNTSQGSFEQVSDEAGPAFNSSYVARGLAAGDFDNDGDTDIVFTNLDATPVLLKNNVGQDSPWIGFELQGTESNRDAIGAKISVQIGPWRATRWVTGGSSYLSSHDRRVVVGLGSHAESGPVNAEIRWPNGSVQRLANLALRKYHRVVERHAR